jgi:hypothetical protein
VTLLRKSERVWTIFSGEEIDGVCWLEAFKSLQRFLEKLHFTRVIDTLDDRPYEIQAALGVSQSL